MDPRKIGALVGRVLLTAGLAAGIFLGTGGVANASDDTTATDQATTQSTTQSDSTSTMMEPGWG